MLFGAVGAHAQYLVTDHIPQPHPIDVQFEKEFTWESNFGNELAIKKAEQAWRKELKKHYEHLLNLLNEKQTKALVASQKAWEAALKADRAFFFAHPDLRLSVGREGEILCHQEFMMRVRKRALDLQQYGIVFLTQPTTETEAVKASP